MGGLGELPYQATKPSEKHKSEDWGWARTGIHLCLCELRLVTGQVGPGHTTHNHAGAPEQVVAYG